MTSVPLGVSARAAGERAVSGDVEDQVVAALGEVLARVVDDVVGAQRADQVDVPRTAHGGDVSSECLGDLHGEAADATRGADDQTF